MMPTFLVNHVSSCSVLLTLIGVFPVCFVKSGTEDLLYHIQYRYRLKTLLTAAKKVKIVHIAVTILQNSLESMIYIVILWLKKPQLHTPHNLLNGSNKALQVEMFWSCHFSDFYFSVFVQTVAIKMYLNRKKQH